MWNESSSHEVAANNSTDRKVGERTNSIIEGRRSGTSCWAIDYSVPGLRPSRAFSATFTDLTAGAILCHHFVAYPNDASEQEMIPNVAAANLPFAVL
ncbi:MAG: hypothetical protein CMJ78_23460 [Planctomycetaceae bacterium]|nr:hypothetical protein [Planctomycetaceae bacterium]